jgi:uncharacterized repeat protein (TIGR03803 family)
MLALKRYVFSICATALLAGCGGSQPPIGAPGAMPQSLSIAGPASSEYRVLHRFQRRNGGSDPFAPLADVNGTLYGTTSTGGLYGDGTVFSVSTLGLEKTLYSFRGSPYDGSTPSAGLADVNGTLYGTTVNGGLNNHCAYYKNHSGCGTVFSITTSGQENVIYAFQGGSDGANPFAGMTDVNGLLYGTTSSTVYSVSTSGVETVLHTFAGGISDGANPSADYLLDVKGTLYGTTLAGGTSGDGVVFSITTSGDEKVLYNFTGGSDGWRPSGGLIGVHGTLYGTTAWGGGSGCLNDGCGTVYSITTKGKEHVLYRFNDGSGGAWSPVGGLTEVSGKLYGTTLYGGSASCKSKGGYQCGTVYSVNMSGAEHVLHSFAGGSDGANPVAHLLDVTGTLYGTTVRKPGTVFALIP